MPAKATGFLDSVTASLVSAVASSALGGSQQPQKKAKAANPSHGSTAPPSTAQPSTSEVTVSVRSPLESALQCLGGPDAVVNAQGLTLVTLTFPKP